MEAIFHQLMRISVRIHLIVAMLIPAGFALAQAPNGPTEEQQRLLEADPRSLLNASNTAGTYYANTRLADMDSRDEREASAQVQIITARQIEAYGIRTLYEALMLVPGFSAALDADNVIGTGIHGNWAMEGKCLYMLDGKALNENDYGTFAIGNRIIMSNVERIEVLLGPGSILHGGYAALAVVNIISRSAETGSGARIDWQTGYADGHQAYNTVGLNGAHRISGQQEFSYIASVSRGNRSNANYLLGDSTAVNLADSTGYEANTFQLGYRWKSLKASAAYLEERHHVAGAPYVVQNRDLLLSLEQRTRLLPQLELEWRATHSEQAPWNFLNTDVPEELASNTTNQRTTAQATLAYKLWDKLTLRIGGQGYLQQSAYQWRGEGSAVFRNGQPTIHFNSLAWYMEAGWRSKIGALTAGFRQEHNELVGSFFAPRIAYTKVIGRFHGKLLWGQAYRIPSIMNITYGPLEESLKGETVTNLEAEAGLRIGHALRITANGYRTSVTNPIVYATEGLFIDNYINRSQSGTYGVDGRIQAETRKASFMAGIGSYRPLPGSDLKESTVEAPGAEALQGLPNMRVLAAIGFDATPWASLHGRLFWQSSAWSLQGYNGAPAALVHWPQQTDLFLGISLKPDKERRLRADIGCSNVLDEARVLVNPQSNNLMPFQLSGRQWQLGLSYKFVK